MLEADDRQPLLAALEANPEAGVGAPTLVETGIVLTARIGSLGRTMLSRFLHEFEVEMIPFDDRHWPVALRAFNRYGKGRHRAGLNLGDCFAYATAHVAGEPLLCVGNDFSRTDLDVIPL